MLLPGTYVIHRCNGQERLARTEAGSKHASVPKLSYADESADVPVDELPSVPADFLTVCPDQDEAAVDFVNTRLAAEVILS